MPSFWKGLAPLAAVAAAAAAAAAVAAAAVAAEPEGIQRWVHACAGDHSGALPLARLGCQVPDPAEAAKVDCVHHESGWQN